VTEEYEYEYYPLVRGPALRIPCTHVVAGFVKRKYKLVPKLNLLGKFEYYPGGIFEKIELYLLPRGAVWAGYYKPGATPAPTACHDESPEEARARLIGLHYELNAGRLSCQNFMIYPVSGREVELYSTYPELRYFVDRCRDRVVPLTL
jgi:hypothetical protein